MATNVSQTYTPSLNVSVTTRETGVSRVTLWTTGVTGSTNVLVDTHPKGK